jgi:hypothetical protein
MDVRIILANHACERIICLFSLLSLRMNSSTSVLLSWIIGRAWGRRWYGRRPSLGLADVCGGGKGGEMHGPVGGVIRYLLSSSYLPCHGPCMTGSFDRAIRHDSLYMLVGTELYS